MIHYLLSEFSEYFSFLNAFGYITTRVGAAVMTSMLLVFLFGPSLIKQLKSQQGEGQPIREDGPASHLLTKKRHTNHGRVDDFDGHRGRYIIMG